MAGPWEKYSGSVGSQGDGPWAKYKATPSATPGSKPSESIGPVLPNPVGILGAYVAKKIAASTPADRRAALEQFGDEATFGHLPQLQAGFSKLLPDPSGGVDAKMRAEGFDIQQAPDNYITTRDETLARLERQKEESPTASLIGRGAGLGASILTTGAAGKVLGLGKAATAGGRIAEAVGTGGVIGGLQNPGETEGDIDLISEIQNRGSNALKGAAIGGVFQGGLEGVSKLAPIISESLGKKAAQKATKTLGGTKKEIQNLQARGQEEALGRQLLDEGAIPLFATPKRVGERVSALKEKAGQEIGDIVSKSGSAKIIDASALADDIAQSPAIAGLSGTPGAEGLAQKATATLETLKKKGTLSLKEAQEVRQNVDKLINFSKQSEELRGIQGVLYEIRSGLRDAMTKAAPALKEPNQRFARLASGEKIVGGKLARDAANRSIGLTDTISGGAGATVGGMIGGPVGAAAGAAVGTAANKFGRTFGAGLQASGLDSASKIAASTPGLMAFAQNNPIKFQVLVNQIANPNVAVSPGQQEFEILQDPEILGIFRSNPQLLDQIRDNRLKSAIQKKLGRAPAVQ